MSVPFAIDSALGEFSWPDIPEILILLDAEKAFDRVEWDYCTSSALSEDLDLAPILYRWLKLSTPPIKTIFDLPYFHVIPFLFIKCLWNLFSLCLLNLMFLIYMLGNLLWKKLFCWACLLFGNIRWCRNIQRNNVYFLYMFVAFRTKDWHYYSSLKHDLWQDLHRVPSTY